MHVCMYLIFITVQQIILKLYIVKKTMSKQITILPVIISRIWIIGNFFLISFMSSKFSM